MFSTTTALFVHARRLVQASVFKVCCWLCVRASPISPGATEEVEIVLVESVLVVVHCNGIHTHSSVSGTAPVLPQSTMCFHKAPLAISRGGRSEALGRSLCVIRVGIHQW